MPYANHASLYSPRFSPTNIFKTKSNYVTTKVRHNRQVSQVHNMHVGKRGGFNSLSSKHNVGLTAYIISWDVEVVHEDSSTPWWNSTIWGKYIGACLLYFTLSSHLRKYQTHSESNLNLRYNRVQKLNQMISRRHCARKNSLDYVSSVPEQAFVLFGVSSMSENCVYTKPVLSKIPEG